ncbi:hypothetical protein GON26_14360 [Flavobacterium sp. GA093]|uniref:Uncharacterized protein n=1 Tax=Flavobacterium hydrocarbonoxydans TaxID=2683249 RepID=A0A6I4NMJ6_9FLAO|nr:hypothetical protein [Flavobacterium hydrocarbonoxydans]MWB95550.1 hypothetical protein [Flavobacterium hydrocarbonoxydans]
MNNIRETESLQKSIWHELGHCFVNVIMGYKLKKFQIQYNHSKTYVNTKLIEEKYWTGCVETDNEKNILEKIESPKHLSSSIINYFIGSIFETACLSVIKNEREKALQIFCNKTNGSDYVKYLYLVSKIENIKIDYIKYFNLLDKEVFRNTELHNSIKFLVKKIDDEKMIITNEAVKKVYILNTQTISFIQLEIKNILENNENLNIENCIIDLENEIKKYPIARICNPCPQR